MQDTGGIARTTPEGGEPAPALPQERRDTSSVVTGLPPDRLEAEIVTLVGRLSSATYDLLVLIGELDVRGTWAFTGALSCAAWLAHRCDVELVTARNQVRVARAMRKYLQLDQAMADGDVSYAKARVLVPHLTSEHADDLVHLASTTPASGLGAAIARWSYGHETAEAIDSRHHDERSISWRTDPDGMVTITARLAPADAAKVCAVIDKQVTTTRAPVGASLRQQRADALAAVVTGGGGQVDAEVVIHVRPEGNTFADGTPLSDHAVGRVLPDAFVSLLMKDNRRQPIDASPRRRFPTRRQRRVIDARSGECAHPGCHARTFLQYDHVQPFPKGGPTVLSNLQRLCGPHNRAKNP